MPPAATRAWRGYEYRTSTDGGSTWSRATAGASVNVTAEGETLVQYRSLDGAGNTSAWTPASATAGSTARIDRTDPTAPTVSGGSLVLAERRLDHDHRLGRLAAATRAWRATSTARSTDGGSSWCERDRRAPR